MFGINKKNIQSDVISDSGVVKKTDSFSIAIIIYSVIMSLVLAALGVAAIMAV